jgi:hypothetical protein
LIEFKDASEKVADFKDCFGHGKGISFSPSVLMVMFDELIHIGRKPKERSPQLSKVDIFHSSLDCG